MRFTRVLINIVILLVFICLFFSVCYLINGSLEMFPTDEQQEKARIAALFLVVVFVSIEVLLVIIKKRILK